MKNISGHSRSLAVKNVCRKSLRPQAMISLLMKKMQTTLTDTNFQKEVLENPEPVLVEFGADWCGACHILAPILEQLHEEFNGQIKIAWLDIEACGHVATEYGIQDLPTLVLFKNGQVVDQITGLVPRQVIASKLRALLN